MENETKEITGTVERKITLFSNNVLMNDPCAICGNRTDPSGFDFGIDTRLICNECANKYAPELMEIQKEALAYAKREKSMIVADIHDKIHKEIYLSVVDRILRVLNEARNNEQN